MTEKRHRSGWNWVPRSCPYQAQLIRCAHITGVYGWPQPFSFDVGLDVALGNIHLCSIALFVCHLLAWKEALVLLSWGALLEGSSVCLATGAGGPVTVCTDHRGSVWMCERTEASGTGLVAPTQSTVHQGWQQHQHLTCAWSTAPSYPHGQAAPCWTAPSVWQLPQESWSQVLSCTVWDRLRTTRKYCNRERGMDKPCKWQQSKREEGDNGWG